MGGTQRVAERAGPARARELVMTGGLYAADDARALERGQPGAARRRPGREVPAASPSSLAAGPTRAHAATKRVVRALLDEGVRGADERMAEIAAPLFETEDLKGAVHTFLEEGPARPPSRAGNSAAYAGSVRRRAGSCRQYTNTHVPCFGFACRTELAQARGKGSTRANRNRQVVQRREGLRLHHAGRRRPRPVRPLLGHRRRRLQDRSPRTPRSSTRKRSATRGRRR